MDLCSRISAARAQDEADLILRGGLTAPFMTLSFLALPVIPALKLTDKGLVDVEQFEIGNYSPCGSRLCQTN